MSSRIDRIRRRSEIIALRSEGLTFREIGERYGISTERVRGVCANTKRLTTKGCVYVVRAGFAVKIGTTKNLKARLLTLQAGCPIQIELLLTLPGGQQVERDLHQRFRSSQLWYEWFRLTDEIKAFIASPENALMGSATVATCCNMSFPIEFLPTHQQGILHRSGGHNAKAVRALEKRRKAILRNPLVSAFTKECRSRGLDWSLVGCDQGFYSSILAVSGLRVALRRASFTPKGYLILGGSSSSCQLDFLAYKTPDDRWLLFRWDERPKSRTTMFALDSHRTPRNRNVNRRRDYRDALNNWTVFTNTD